MILTRNSVLEYLGEVTIAPITTPILNFWTLNPNTGAIVRRILARAKPGRFLQIFASGYWDADDDGDTELVLAYVRYVGLTRYDYVFDHYDIVTGKLERPARLTS